MWKPPSETIYNAPGNKEYHQLDVYAFHIAPTSGDVFLHCDHTGLPIQVRIFRDDWDGFVRTVRGEHAHMVSPGVGTGHTPDLDTDRYDTGGTYPDFTDTPDTDTATPGTDAGTDAGTDTR